MDILSDKINNLLKQFEDNDNYPTRLRTECLDKTEILLYILPDIIALENQVETLKNKIVIDNDLIEWIKSYQNCSHNKFTIHEKMEMSKRLLIELGVNND
jgi:hypothetical protein